MIPLRLTAIQKSYDHRRVVDIEHLQINPGELVALLGPSGCGKSTSLRMIAGLESLDHGRIELDEATVADARFELPVDKRNVGLVFQDYALFPHLTVAQNIGYGLRRSPKKTPRIQELLSVVGLSGFERRYPRELSGGQQQRIALARALAPRPKLLLFDEPFSSLDPGLRQQVRSEVRAILRKTGTPALLVTHDQEEALSIADRVAVMFDGQIAQIDTPANVYLNPVSPTVAAFVGDVNLLPGFAHDHVIDTPLGQLRAPGDLQGSVSLMVRPEMIRLVYPTENRGVSGTVLAVEFFGHDHLLAIQVADGQTIQVRQCGICQYTIGQAVHIELELGDRVRIYPEASTA